MQVVTDNLKKYRPPLQPIPRRPSTHQAPANDARIQSCWLQAHSIRQRQQVGMTVKDLLQQWVH